MVRHSVWFTMALGLALVAGCGGENASTDTATTSNTTPPYPPSTQAAPAPGEADKAKANPSEVKLTDEEIAKIKELPEGEQAAALEQKICPSSDEHLGSMGVPIKFTTAEGQTFYLCCDGCKKDVEKDPKAALAKLGRK